MGRERWTLETNTPDMPFLGDYGDVLMVVKEVVIIVVVVVIESLPTSPCFSQPNAMAAQCLNQGEHPLWKTLQGLFIIIITVMIMIITINIFHVISLY